MGRSKPLRHGNVLQIGPGGVALKEKSEKEERKEEGDTLVVTIFDKLNIIDNRIICAERTQRPDLLVKLHSKRQAQIDRLHLRLVHSDRVKKQQLRKQKRVGVPGCFFQGVQLLKAEPTMSNDVVWAMTGISL